MITMMMSTMRYSMCLVLLRVYDMYWLCLSEYGCVLEYGLNNERLFKTRGKNHDLDGFI